MIPQLAIDITVGLGFGLTGGIPFGVARAYKKAHWLYAIVYTLLGVSLINDPEGGLTLGGITIPQMILSFIFFVVIYKITESEFRKTRRIPVPISRSFSA